MAARRSLLLLSPRLRRLHLPLAALCLALAGAAPAAADEETQPQVIQPEVERRSVDLARIDSENFELGLFFGMLAIEDFGTNPVYGARLAYHVGERLFVEAALGRSKGDKTSYERLSGAAELLSDDDRELTYYNLSLGFNLLPSESFPAKDWAFNSALYIIAGVGSTRFAGGDAFTVNFGAGYRFLATDWLALHLDVRDHMFDVDLLGENKLTHNLELTTGFTVFF